MTIRYDLYSALPYAVKIQKYMEEKQMGNESMGNESRCITLEAKIGDRYVPIRPFESLGDIWSTLLRDMTVGTLIPKRILRHGPATIVFWCDGTKTVVKRAPDEPDNEYAAFTAALAIKIFGSNSKLKKIVKTFTEEQK